MKYYWKVSLLFLLFVFGGYALSQDNMFQLMEKVTIKKVKMIQLPEDRNPDHHNRYYADMLLTVKNDNPHRLGLKDFDFILKMKAACNDEAAIRVGDVRSGSAELIIPPNGEKDFMISAYLGSSFKEVFQRISIILNIVGNPQNQVCINLEGKCKVGAEGSRGWYYQDGFEVNLRFQPKVQREVLVE